MVESVQKAVEEKLLSSDVSRTYYSQAFLPGAVLPISLEREGGDEERRRGGKQGGSGPSRKKGGMVVIGGEVITVFPRKDAAATNYFSPTSMWRLFEGGR